MTPFEIAFIATLARGAVLVPVLLTAELLLRRTLTAGCRRILWCICAIWLVIPQPSSRALPWQVDFSHINNRVQKAIVNHAPRKSGKANAKTTTVSDKTPSAPSAISGRNFSIGPAFLRQWRNYELLLLFLAGFPVCLWLWYCYLRCRRNIRRLPEIDDPRVLRIWRRVSGPSRLRLLDADSIGLNPTLFGFWHQRLLLPMNKLRDLSDLELELLLEHEYCHYRAGDGYLNMMTLIFSRFFWFNPLIFLVRRRLRQSCELHCDEQVMRRHPEALRTYGNLLLRFAGAPTPPPVAMGLSEKPRELSRRIRSMVRGLPSPNTARAGRVSVLFLILVLSCPVFLVAVNIKPRFTRPPRIIKQNNPAVPAILPHLMLEYAFAPKSGTMRWKIQYSPNFPYENSTLTLRYDDRVITRSLAGRPPYIELEMKRDLENIQFTYHAALGRESIEKTFALPMADNNRFAGKIELDPNRSVPLLEMLPFEKLPVTHISWNEVAFQRVNNSWNYQREYTLQASLSIPGLNPADYRSPVESRAEANSPILLIERDLNLPAPAAPELNPELVKASEKLRLLEYENTLGGVDYDTVLRAREAVIRLELQKLEAVGDVNLTPRWLKYREDLNKELQDNLQKRQAIAAALPTEADL